MPTPTRMFHEPEHDSVRVWRYMSYDNFMKLLESKTLYVSRSTEFEDPYDCMFPKGLERRLNRDLSDIAVSEAQQTDEYRRGGTAYQLGFGRAHGQRQHLYGVKEAKALREGQPEFKRELFISCWHAGDDEPAALWSIYSKRAYPGAPETPKAFWAARSGPELAHPGPAVAIRTTYASFRDWFYNLGESEYYIGMVKYIDFSVSTDNAVCASDRVSAAMYKRKSFEYEKEVRAVIRRPADSGRRGIHLPFSMPDMKIEVMLAPNASDGWLQDLQKHVMRVYGGFVPVWRSDLFTLS